MDTKITTIDAYIKSAKKEAQPNLKEMHKLVQSLIPDGVECISYGMPTFKLNGKSVIGLAAFTNHLGFFPMSGSFLEDYKKDLEKYETTKSGLHLPLTGKLPTALLKKLIKARIDGIDQKK